MNTGTCKVCGYIGYLDNNGKCIRCMEISEDIVDREIQNRIERELDEERVK